MKMKINTVITEYTDPFLDGPYLAPKAVKDYDLTDYTVISAPKNVEPDKTEVWIVAEVPDKIEEDVKKAYPNHEEIKKES